MNLKNKDIVIASQIVIILAFFTGMWLNYFTLLPFIDKGEEARLSEEINAYCYNFYPETGCDVRDASQRDSVLSLNLDPYRGFLVIMDGDAEIIYSQDGGTGNGIDLVAGKYGVLAKELMELEMDNPTSKSRMQYDKKNKISMYACYEPDLDLSFFYAVDYLEAGSETLKGFNYLLIFMVVGGFVVVGISFFIVRNIAKQVREESLVQQELDTAAVIQKSMMPRGERHLISLDIDARLIPAKKVGGDFYCYLLRDGLLYFCIGDVSGKGIPASLFMSKAVTLFRSFSSSRLKVQDLAHNMNRELCMGNEQNMFMTAILGTVRVFDGMITYVNAGHEAPVIWDGKKDSKLEYLSSKGSVPFGILDDAEFEVESYQMEKNGMILLYTDGVSEARSGQSVLLGRKKLLDILEPVKALSSKEINDILLNNIREYESGVEQSDDITLLTFINAFKSKGLTLLNEISELSKIPAFMDEIFLECKIPQKDHILVRSGLDEALTNCVLYAYDSPGNKIELSATVESSKLCFTITDNGRPFNPLEYQAPITDELKVGGLGISMYKANFDDVKYERKDNSNILKLIKNL